MHPPAPSDTSPASAATEISARQLSELLDAKAERLEKLIAHAEELIAILEHVGTTAPARVSTATKASRPSVGGTASGGHEVTKSTEALQQLATAREPEPTDSLRRAIYALADASRSPAEIARELDEHIGKVELILALRYG